MGGHSHRGKVIDERYYDPPTGYGQLPPSAWVRPLGAIGWVLVVAEAGFCESQLVP